MLESEPTQPRERQLPWTRPRSPLSQRAVLGELLGVLAAEAYRYDGSVRVTQDGGRWRVSLTSGRGELVAADDEYLHLALARLWAAAGALGPTRRDVPTPARAAPPVEG